MTTIAIAGHICVDLAPSIGHSPRVEPGTLVDVGPLALSLGGCVANVSRTLNGLGQRVTAYAVVGADPLARIVRNQLDTSLIDARIREVPASTSYSLVFEPPGRDRTFWHHVGANAYFDGHEIEAEEIDILHVGYPSLLPGVLREEAAALIELLASARRAGASVSIDLAVVDPASDTASLDWPYLLRLIAAQSDVLTPSLDDLSSVLRLDADDDADLAELFADLLVTWGAGIVVVSAGARGLVMRTADARRLQNGGRVVAELADMWANQTLRIPALHVPNVRTTNGAGDASTAAILYALSRGLTPHDALRLATACSGAVVSGMGVSPASIRDFAPELSEFVPTKHSAVLLPANQPSGRFYRGGEQIAQFRGDDRSTQYTPEDWIGSTVCVRNESPVGLTTLPAGEILSDAIAADPVGWLGDSHVERYGGDPMLLVKLLDAGQRLPVHAHPGAEFAARHLGARHGKAEAWHILTPGVVYLGLRRNVDAAELGRITGEQDTEELLALLHSVDVFPGDRVFVPPGVLHAIGEGVLLLEVQEPEDLSILLEWRDFEIDGEQHGHLGLGFSLALEAVEQTALTVERLDDLVLRAQTGGALPQEAEVYFRLERVNVDGAHREDAGFMVIVGLEGMLSLEAGAVLDLSRGATALVPAGAGPVVLSGNGAVLIARPPVADQ